MQIYCPGCGDLYDEKDRNAHRGCASNKRLTASNVTKPASNNEAVDIQDAASIAGPEDASAVPEVRRAVDGADGAASPMRKQRWSREAYNAYQREYMRKRRADKRPS